MLSLAVLSTGGLLAFMASRPAPIELRVLSIERTGMFDEAGEEPLLMTLSVTNKHRVRVEFQLATNYHCRVGNQWVEAKEYFQFGRFIGSGNTSERSFIVPAGTDAFRTRVNYQTEHWRVQMIAMLSRERELWLMTNSPLWLRTRLWPSRSTMPYPPRWKTLSFELSVPQDAAQSAD